MQVTPNMASTALAPPSTMQSTTQHSTPTVAMVDKRPAPVVFAMNFAPPDKADPQSVVQAQIKDTVTALATTAQDPKADADAARAAEQQAEAAARTKSIMGMLPANPSDVTKLMSALAAATSAEAIADIKLDAQSVD